MAAKKNSTKANNGEERFTATGKGITVLTPGGADKTGKTSTKGKKKRGGK